MIAFFMFSVPTINSCRARRPRYPVPLHFSHPPFFISIVAGEAYGRLHLLCLENVEPGPPVLTVWRGSRQQRVAFGCTLCRAWSEVPASALGTELPCPHCGKAVKLNPFVIEADWRPVAAAWRGET